MKFNDKTPRKKRKTWLWILGWIVIFPVPLTILMLKNQKINKIAKSVIIVVAWIFYLLIVTSGGSDENEASKQTSETAMNSSGIADESDNQTEENIKSLKFSETDDVTVKVGESYCSDSLRVALQNSNDFSAEKDLIFVSDNPEIATLTFTEFSSGTTLKYEITGVDAGETDVYVTSSDGNVMSEKIHVIVTESITVEKIELSGYMTELVIGEIVEVSATISPMVAEDKTLTWTSSDETVATVNEQGSVIAIGGGTATITATASNGVEASFNINVDGSKALMKLNVSHSRDDDVNIGSEWSYDTQINGESASKTIVVGVGETLSFYAKFTEDDEIPDVGTAQTTYTVTEEDIENGFTITMNLYVTENGGKNKGKSAHFVVTYMFSPNN